MQIRLETKADNKSSQCRDRPGEKIPKYFVKEFCLVSSFEVGGISYVTCLDVMSNDML